MTTEELQAKATETLQEMTAKLGIDTQVQVVATENDNFKLQVTAAEAGRLIGRRGQTLESLELLLNRIIRRNSEEAPWIPVEIDGYSTGRTGAETHHHHGLDKSEIGRFRAMARDAAKEVRMWKEPKKLGPFNPAERRQIHLALQDDEELTTVSEPLDDGSNKKYVIIQFK